MFQYIGMMLIRLDGSPKYAMLCNVIPGLLNVFLDWLFIFPLGLGIKGAAMATAYTMLRAMAFVVPSLMLLPLTIGTSGLWLAIPVFEMLTLAVILTTHYFIAKTPPLSR